MSGPRSTLSTNIVTKESKFAGRELAAERRIPLPPGATAIGRKLHHRAERGPDPWPKPAISSVDLRPSQASRHAASPPAPPVPQTQAPLPSSPNLHAHAQGSFAYPLPTPFEPDTLQTSQTNAHRPTDDRIARTAVQPSRIPPRNKIPFGCHSGRHRQAARNHKQLRCEPACEDS